MHSSLAWTFLAIVCIVGYTVAQQTFPRRALNTGNYFVSWTCYPNDTVEFQIEVRAGGWIGFGLSPDGRMPNSDVVILMRDGTFSDRHTTGRSPPNIDVEQNWFLLNAATNADFRVARFWRPLISPDNVDDLGIARDAAVILIYAWRNTADDQFVAHDVRGASSPIVLCPSEVDPTPTPMPPASTMSPASPTPDPQPSLSTPSPSPSPSPSPPPIDPNCTGVTCINMQTLDPADCTCKCLFAGFPCPFNQMFNTDICACEDLGPCPEVTNTTCPDGQRFSRISCDCVDECNRNCSVNQLLDENLCECVCVPSILDPGTPKCPSPLSFNPDTCLCDCSISCSPPSELDSDNCACTCPNVSRSCPPGQTFDPSMCICRCNKEEECCEGRVFNTAICQCECADTSECPSGEMRNPKTCECECAAKFSEDLWYQKFGQCWKDNYKVFSIFSCGCECPKFLTCPQGKVINPANCRCGCPPRPPSCPQHKYYNPNTCQCYCPTRRHCKYGSKFSEGTCRCECTIQSCPAGKRLDTNSCSCVCATSQASCPAGKKWDSSTCGCVCARKSCGSSQYFDPHSCQCRCRQYYNCPSGKRWDSSKCACVCTPQHCPYNKRWDAASCSCKCSAASSCGSGWAYNPSTCSCQCAKRCGHYQTLDRHSCQCRYSYYPSTQPPTTRPPATSPPSGCSKYLNEYACKTSGYYGHSCKWYNGRCVSHCCQFRSQQQRGKRTLHPNWQSILRCQSYNQYYCTRSHFCSWGC